MTHQRTLTAAHWGVYEVEYDEKGQAAKLHPFAKDPDPSPIGLHMLSDEVARLRVRRPAFRKSWLERGPGAARRSTAIARSSAAPTAGRAPAVSITPTARCTASSMLSAATCATSIRTA